jgi:hypothetical protein
MSQLDETHAEGRRRWEAELAAMRNALVKAIGVVKLSRSDQKKLRRALALFNKYSSMQSSERRLLVFLPLLEDAPPAVFWPALFENWDTCDAAWPLQSALLRTMLVKTAIKPAAGYYGRGASDLLQSLPDPIRVFRGCSRERIKGIAWTTDEGVAEVFARGHRNIVVPEPVVAAASNF